MFKIKGFYVLWLLLLSVVCQPVWAGNDTVKRTQEGQGTAIKMRKDTCYPMGAEVKDISIPCCPGLEKFTEVDTHRIFCDVNPGESSVVWIWTLMLIFPLFLVVFLIFGIRNRMAKRKTTNS